MASRRASGVISKWAGLLIGPAAWFAHQQILSALIHARCPPGVSRLVLVAGAVCVLIAVAAALVSWRARADFDVADMTAAVDKFAATLSAGVAGVSALAIVFASAAGAILQCQR